MSVAMRSRGRILVACISLAGYLLALAGAAVFHDHAHHAHAHHDHAAGTSTSAPAAHTHSHADGCCHTHDCHTAHAEHQPAPAHHRHPTPDAPHDDCPICQFLALKVLASSPPATVAGAELIAATATPVAPLVTPAPCWRPLSRGPPANA
jgi:hypothetical protein